MKHSTAYHSLIARYYLKPISAEGVALALNARLRSTIITAAKVKAVFDAEYESNFVYRQLGERPAQGFAAENPHVQLAGRLMGAAAA